MARRVFFIFCLNSFFAMRIAEAAAILCQHSGDSETKHSWDAKMAARSLDFLSPSGDKLDLYTLSSKDGIEVDVLSFGATLTSLWVPKKLVATCKPYLRYRSFKLMPICSAVAARCTSIVATCMLQLTP